MICASTTNNVFYWKKLQRLKNKFLFDVCYDC
jgi:hypothetical protein